MRLLRGSPASYNIEAGEYRLILHTHIKDAFAGCDIVRLEEVESQRVRSVFLGFDGKLFDAAIAGGRHPVQRVALDQRGMEAEYLGLLGVHADLGLRAPERAIRRPPVSRSAQIEAELPGFF